MYKHILKIVTVVSLVLTLFTACTETSVETGNTIEVDASDPAVKLEEAKAIAKTGKCILNPPKEPVACTMQYDPVCGCDNKTYGNACMARGAGVPYSTPGACEENPNN